MSKEMNVNIATQWSDVSLGAYQQLVSIFNTDSDLLTKELLVLEALTDKTYDELQNFTTIQIKELLKRTSFLTTPPKEDFQYEIQLDGEKYIPKLLIEEFEAGRFIDIQTFLKDPTENLHLIVASILDKKIEYPMWQVWKMNTIEDYGEKDIKELADKVYNHMPITQVNALASFFLRNYVALWTTIQDYSEGEKTNLKEMVKNQMKGNTENTGDGSSQSQELAKKED